MENKRRPVWMERTEIAAERSAAQIVEKLVSIGARRVSMVYDENRKLAGIDFTLAWQRLELPFSIPARVWALLKLPQFAPGMDPTRREAHAARVAWRQLFRWVEAQAAIIETGMVSNIEVFTPYRITGDGPNRRTLYEVMIEGDIKALPPAEERRQ